MKHSRRTLLQSIAKAADKQPTKREPAIMIAMIRKRVARLVCKGEAILKRWVREPMAFFLSGTVPAGRNLGNNRTGTNRNAEYALRYAEGKYPPRYPVPALQHEALKAELTILPDEMLLDMEAMIRYFQQ